MKKVENGTGVHPVEFKVLIKMDEAERQTSGKIIIPETARTRQQYEMEKGTLIAKGGMAFSDDCFSKTEFETLVPGARVMVNKYAGSVVKGDDRATYRLCNDKDIIAILTEEA